MKTDLNDINTLTESYVEWMSGLYVTDTVNLFDEEDDSLSDIYSEWLCNMREALPYDEQKRILKRIRLKLIKRERKILEEFNRQFK